MTTEHTPTPWYAVPAQYDAGKTMCIQTAEGDVLAFIEGPLQPSDHANAAFIVRAANAHDALVKALRLVLDHDGKLTGADLATIQSALALTEGED